VGDRVSYSSYRGGYAAWLDFCRARNVPPTLAGLSAPVICVIIDLFVTELIDCEKVYSSVRKYLYGVRDYIVRRTGADPIPHDYADKVLLKAEHECISASFSAQPFAPAWLLTMRARHGIVYFTAGLIMYCFLLRFSEAAPTPSQHYIRACHVSVTVGPGGRRCLTVTVPSSKTDQTAAGSTHSRMELPGSPLCPVAAWEAYQRSVPLPAGPYAPALRDLDGRPLTRTRMTAALRDTVAALGLPPELYTLHSFRCGGATAAMTLGMSKEWLRFEGRWSDDKSVRPYIKLSHHVTAPAFSALLLGAAARG
jgi:hypothetical protein